MEDARLRIHKLLLIGDNRLKQGVATEKVRASYEEALRVAREAGLEEQPRRLVEIRLAHLEGLGRNSPHPSPPEAGRRERPPPHGRRRWGRGAPRPVVGPRGSTPRSRGRPTRPPRA